MARGEAREDVLGDLDGGSSFVLRSQARECELGHSEQVDEKGVGGSQWIYRLGVGQRPKRHKTGWGKGIVIKVGS